MGRVQRLQVFFNKDVNDYTTGQVDPYKFHLTFYYMCKFFRVIDDEPDAKWTLPTLMLLVACGVIAGTICLLCFIQYLVEFDIPLVTEAGTYFIIMSYQLLIIHSSFSGKIHYKNFLQAMRDDFNYICTQGKKYRKKFFINHLWTWKATILCTIFVLFIAVGMSSCGHLALIYWMLYPSEESGRPLPFPFWLSNVNFEKSPAYEVAYVFYNMCILSFTIVYLFLITIQIVWIRQIMSKADVIIWSIQDLLVDILPTSDKKQKHFYAQLIESRMREIIKMHHSMYNLLEAYAGIYTKMLMFEQKTCSPLLCLTAYSAAEKLNAGQNPGILALLCIAVFVLCYIPSYMCSALSEKVQAIGYACYETPFWNAPGKVLRMYFVIILQISRRPLAIQAPGFNEVTLETFADNVKFAYTGFNMLRNVKYDQK